MQFVQIRYYVGRTLNPFDMFSTCLTLIPSVAFQYNLLKLSDRGWRDVEYERTFHLTSRQKLWFASANVKTTSDRFELGFHVG